MLRLAYGLHLCICLRNVFSFRQHTLTSLNPYLNNFLKPTMHLKNKKMYLRALALALEFIAFSKALVFAT